MQTAWPLLQHALLSRCRDADVDADADVAAVEDVAVDGQADAGDAPLDGRSPLSCSLKSDFTPFVAGFASQTREGGVATRSAGVATRPVPRYVCDVSSIVGVSCADRSASVGCLSLFRCRGGGRGHGGDGRVPGAAGPQAAVRLRPGRGVAAARLSGAAAAPHRRAARRLPAALHRRLQGVLDRHSSTFSFQFLFVCTLLFHSSSTHHPPFPRVSSSSAQLFCLAQFATQVLPSFTVLPLTLVNEKFSNHF